MNLDLDVRAKHGFEELLDSIKGSVIVLHRTTEEASVELNRNCSAPEEAIQHFVALIHYRLTRMVIMSGNGEMKVTLDDIRQKFDALCSGEESREAIADFASRAREANDTRALEMEPEHKKKIWDAIMYLTGVDLKDSPNSYLHINADFEEFRKRLGI
jgi:hypothetical protein